MGEIFISYAHADRRQVEQLVAALEAAGLSIWWDQNISGGQRFSMEAETQLNKAAAVVVVWTQASVKSMWVADEASVGRDKGALVPISLDGTAPPIGFRQLQVLAFDRWRGEAQSPEIDALVQSLRRLTSADAPPPTTRRPTILWRRWRWLFATAAGVAAGGGVVWFADDARNEPAPVPAGSRERDPAASGREARIELLSEKLSGGRAKTWVDERYISRILRQLANSEQPSDAAVLALIEHNDVDRAIASLEERLNTAKPGSREQRDLLHQVGALAYERNLNKSIAAYEEIVRIEANDFDAVSMLGRAFARQDRHALAQSMYERARNIGTSDERAMLELQIDVADIAAHQQKPEGVEKALEGVVERAKAGGFLEAAARAQTLLAQAHFDLGETAESKAYLTAAMAQQKALRLDADFADALNIMGQIEEREGRTEAAASYYAEQLKVNQALGRMTGVAYALYYLGGARLDLGELDEAERLFSEGVRIASENGIAESKFMHLVGLARVAHRRSSPSAACGFMSEAEAAFPLESMLGPRTRANIEDIGCGFAPLGIAPREG
jgi:tetratricopeptide (TPR) repeat protein